MLMNSIKPFIEKTLNDVGIKPALFQEEKEYAEKHGLVPTETDIVKMEPLQRFTDAYIERLDKETEKVLAEETFSFLNQPLAYLKKKKNEFVYLESPWFEMIGVDAVSIEVDDVFSTYDVMLGLKVQKKYQPNLKKQLDDLLKGEGAKYDLMFNQDDGLWDLNFTLDFLEGFREELSIGEAYALIYQFLFRLLEKLEDTK